MKKNSIVDKFEMCAKNEKFQIHWLTLSLNIEEHLVYYFR